MHWREWIASFLGKRIADLGCGDGTNTLRIKRILKSKNIVGYERNGYLIDRAKKRSQLPCGEMGTFILSIHHLEDKERILRQAMKNFKYIVICDPIRDLYHALFDAGHPLKTEEWRNVLDKVFKRYVFYQYRNTFVAFYSTANEAGLLV